MERWEREMERKEGYIKGNNGMRERLRKDGKNNERNYSQGNSRRKENEEGEKEGRK